MKSNIDRKVNLFYITDFQNAKALVVKHRQLCGEDKDCAYFYYEVCTVSKTRAMKAAKVFCKQMNTYYPLKLRWPKK